MYSRIVDDRNGNILLDNVERIDAENWLRKNRKDYVGVEGLIAIEDIDDDGEMVEWYLLDQLIEDACGGGVNAFYDY